MSDNLVYDAVVVGGGPAGLTTALYTTRLGHRTAVFEKGGGRHETVGSVHNLLGVSEDVSGWQLAELAVGQLEEYGCDFYRDEVEEVEQRDAGAGGRFLVEGVHATVASERIVLATGFTDVEPDVPGLTRFTGRGLHYCLHCDAYTLGDAPVFVLGHDDHAAEVAMLMLNFTDDVDLLLDGHPPEWSDETDRLLRAHPVARIEPAVAAVFPEREDGAEPWLGGFTFAGGAEREYVGGFAIYGKQYNTRLADALGCDLTDDGAIDVDRRGETSVDGAYAVGDVTHGQNQTTIAIGDGARAGIAIHKDLRRYPLSAEEVEGGSPSGELDVPGAPADVRARMRRDRERTTHRGLSEPAPER